MITKEEYLEWRSKPDMNYKVYYSYFMDNKSLEWKDIDLEHFTRKFAEFIAEYNGKLVAGTDRLPKAINYNNIIRKCKNHFDHKFNVTL